jgi:valyl-tRNA synthetase
MAQYSTGFLKVTPAHDFVDYEIGARHRLPLINVLNPDGTINENGGAYRGLTVQEARTRVVEDLRAQGLLVETRPYSHEVAHSERSHAAIEPFLSEQWFVNTGGLARQAAQAVEDGRVRFFPQRYAKTYLDWLGALRDWCISRQIWWGHRLPIWYCQNPACFEPEQYAGCQAGSSEADCSRWRYFFSDLEDPTRCPKCGGTDIVQDEDVLDTWFSSALWPFSTMGWPEKTAELATYYPTSVLVTARDIITLWVARMVMMGLYHIGDVPFRDVYIYPTILDGRGVIMSKSKGNGVDPLDIIATYGADGMRATLALMATETQDLRMPVRKTVLTDGREVNTSDRFAIGRNFANKLWNASRFVLMNLEGCPSGLPDLAGLTAPDRWVLSRLAATAGLVTWELGETYGVSTAMGALYHFVWHDFCDWYLELTKARLRAGGDEKKLAQRMLAFVLDQSLRLLHPFIPFLTEAVWQQLNAVLPERTLSDQLPAPPACALVVARWPALDEELIDPGLEAEFALLQEVARAIRRSKRSVGLEERTPLAAVLSCHDQETSRLLESLAPLLIEAAVLSNLEVDVELPRPVGSVTQVLERLQLFLPVADLVDVARERVKLEKQLQGCEQQLTNVRQRLANEEFLRKAPAEVVEREEARAQELANQSELLRTNLAGLPKV